MGITNDIPKISEKDRFEVSLHILFVITGIKYTITDYTKSTNTNAWDNCIIRYIHLSSVF